MTVPIIDVAALVAPESDSYDQMCQELEDVYSTIGFGYIRNHGISRRLIEGIFEASRMFHAMPREKKLKIELDYNHRGFIPIHSATEVNSEIEEAEYSNHSESFMMMREAGPEDPDVLAGTFLAGANQWPDDLPGFREQVTAYHDALTSFTHKLLEAVIRSVGADFFQLEPYFDPPTTFLRLLYYPELSPEAPENLYGSAPHVDFGCLTLLAQDDAGGLQVQGLEGDWLDVPPIQDTFVMNVGTMLNRWSNGHFRSTPHRVINGSSGSRYSVPFFYDPHVDTQVAPLKCCTSKGSSIRFSPIAYGDFVRQQLVATYPYHRRNYDKML